MIAAYDDNAIWGVGATEREARADAALVTTNVEELRIAPMTVALADLVDVEGGDVAFFRLADGRLGTEDDAEASAAAAAEFGARIESLAADTPLTGATETWQDARREMLRDMARACLAGNPQVALSPAGALNWTAAAKLRRDTAPDQKIGRLSHDYRTAAAEIAANLGIQTYLIRISNHAAAKRARLAGAGTLLFGGEWVMAMGREFGVAPRTMQRWAAGETEIPERVMVVDLPAIIGRLGPARLREIEAQRAGLRKLLDDVPAVAAG